MGLTLHSAQMVALSSHYYDEFLKSLKLKGNNCIICTNRSADEGIQCPQQEKLVSKVNPSIPKFNYYF